MTDVTIDRALLERTLDRLAHGHDHDKASRELRAILDQPAPDVETVWCGCGDGYPASSYDAGFIDGRGACENCDAPESIVKPEVEAVEVVAHMYQHDETGLVGFVDQQQVDWGFERNNPRLLLCGELMAVAQHNRIVKQLA